MNKIKSIILVIGIGMITSLFAFSFFGFFSQPEDFCNQEFRFLYDEQDDYVQPIKEVKEYLLNNFEGEINVNKIGGYGMGPPNSDPSKPTTWIIQINDRLVKNPADIELIKNSLESNPKIHDLRGPFDSCP